MTTSPDPNRRYVIRMVTTAGKFFWTNYVHNMNAFGWHQHVEEANVYERKVTTHRRAKELYAAYSKVFPIIRVEVVPVLLDEQRKIATVLEGEHEFIVGLITAEELLQPPRFVSTNDHRRHLHRLERSAA